MSDTGSFRRTDVVGGALSSAHFTIRTAMPVLLASLASAHGFTDGQLGNIASAYSIGATLIAVTSMLWMRTHYLRLQTGSFVALGLAALTTVALRQSYSSLLATFMLRASASAAFTL